MPFSSYKPFLRFLAGATLALVTSVSAQSSPPGDSLRTTPAPPVLMPAPVLPAVPIAPWYPPIGSHQAITKLGELDGACEVYSVSAPSLPGGCLIVLCTDNTGRLTHTATCAPAPCLHRP